MRYIWLILVIAPFLLGSCQKSEHLESGEFETSDTLYAEVKLDIDLLVPNSKMREVSENLLSDYNVYIFNSLGDIVDRFFMRGEPSFRIRVSQSEEYAIYVVANAGSRIDANTLDELLEYDYKSPVSDGVSMENGGIVMCGKVLNTHISDGCVIPVVLERRVAQIVVFADTSALYKDVHLKVEQISIIDAPAKVKLFGPSKIVATSDKISYSFDYSGLFDEGAVAYLYENMQGVLKPSNSEYSGKALDIGEDGYGVSSYIELKCRYTSSRYDGIIYYKFYLGKDEFTNFDVEGNSKYLIKIYFTGNGSVRENSWRVVTSDLNDNLHFTFKYNVEHMYVNSNLLVEWGVFVSDEQMPLVESGDTTALKVVDVSPLGVYVRGLRPAQTTLKASLAGKEATCTVNIY